MQLTASILPYKSTPFNIYHLTLNIIPLNKPNNVGRSISTFSNQLINYSAQLIT
jgi:hypothetical protein